MFCPVINKLEEDIYEVRIETGVYYEYHKDGKSLSNNPNKDIVFFAATDENREDLPYNLIPF